MLGSEAPGPILHRPSRKGESRRGLEGLGRLSVADGERGPHAEFGVKIALARFAPASLLATSYSFATRRIARAFHRITADASPAAQPHDQRRTAVGTILRRVGRAPLLVAALAFGANPRLRENLQPLRRNEPPTVFTAPRGRPVTRIVFQQSRRQSQFATTSARNLGRQRQGQLAQFFRRRLAMAM